MESSLLVVDLDTVFDDRVCDRDRMALERLRSTGCEIGFTSSGRAAAARARMRALGLEGWIIGCDGAQLARARDGHLLCRHSLPASIAARAQEILSAMQLEVFAVTADGAHGPPGAHELAQTALGFASEGYTSAPALRAEICALVAAGDTARVHAGANALTELAPTRIARATYSLPSGGSALRVSSRRGSRARAIGDLAARLGTRRTRAAYVTGVRGPYVDASAILELPRVFCLPDVPVERLGARCERLVARAGEGALAEAIDRWRRTAAELVHASA
ncbi:HAD hydrolase family protein [Sandaracinus amylolyticus]|uniref:HAD hydrolase family protein n=1 Tax=Sandaracinus amylolyticus TaxID=927083 RepID=UPI001F2C0564|nr:HAD hydrolase family protein [Sandaracinus amylolyticus]